MFFRQHWRGKLSLSVSLWLNFLLIGTSYHLLEPYLLNIFFDNAAVFIPLTVAYLVLTRFIIYPWQLIGLLRAADSHFKTTRRSGVLYCIQGLLLASLIGTTSHIIGVTQRLFAYQEDIAFYANQSTPQYTFKISDDKKTLHFRGVFEFGVTEAMTKQLQQFPSIKGVILESEGGQIYEGRGVAKLIERLEIDTYTFEQCLSACTTAFIGGKTRYLGQGAKLGFHQYGFDPKHWKQISPSYDLKSEQKKDAIFYRNKQISEAFIQKLFETPHREMWFPSPQILMQAGVVNRLVDKEN